MRKPELPQPTPLLLNLKNRRGFIKGTGVAVVLTLAARPVLGEGVLGGFNCPSEQLSGNLSGDLHQSCTIGKSPADWLVTPPPGGLSVTFNSLFTPHTSIMDDSFSSLFTQYASSDESAFAAAYLNAEHFYAVPGGYPLSTAQVLAIWTQNPAIGLNYLYVRASVGL